MQCIHNGFGLHKLGRELTGPGSEQIGEQIFGTWVWPFELLSLLLLAALVAAVAVATTGRSKDETS